MQLAHVAYPGGPELELLIFAGALLVLSIVFFFGKVAKPSVSVGLLIGAVVVGTTSFLLGGDASAATASVSIDSPSSGSTVEAGEPVFLEVTVDGGEVVGQTSSRDAGHVRVLFDGKLSSMPLRAAPEVELEPGRHTLTAEHVDEDHLSFEPKVFARIGPRAR